MSEIGYTLLSAVIGIVCGFFTIHSFFATSWTSMILWVVVGILILYFSNNRRSAVYASGTFGFFTIVSWLASGFDGASNQLGGFAALTLGLGVLGALCGVSGAFLFYWLFRRT